MVQYLLSIDVTGFVWENWVISKTTQYNNLLSINNRISRGNSKKLTNTYHTYKYQYYISMYSSQRITNIGTHKQTDSWPIRWHLVFRGYLLFLYAVFITRVEITLWNQMFIFIRFSTLHFYIEQLNIVKHMKYYIFIFVIEMSCKWITICKSARYLKYCERSKLTFLKQITCSNMIKLFVYWPFAQC